MADSAVLARPRANIHGSEFERDMADMFTRRRSGHAIRHFFSGQSLVLWEAFTRASRDYYLFEDEAKLIKENAPAIAEKARAALQGSLTVVELGTGSAKAVRAKTIPMLEALKPDVYIPTDWSAESVHVAAHLAQQALPGLDVRPRVMDFNQQAYHLPKSGRTVLLQFGSTLSNIEGRRDDALPLEAMQTNLKHYRRQLQQNDLAIFGLDQNQDRQSLMAAYEHPLHVAFSESVLTRMKDELPVSSSFNPAAFTYVPLWNEATHQLAHLLIALEDGSFELGDETIRYVAGDRFVYDNSWKFPQGVLDGAFSNTGYVPVRAPIRDVHSRISLQVMKAV